MPLLAVHPIGTSSAPKLPPFGFKGDHRIVDGDSGTTLSQERAGDDALPIEMLRLGLSASKS